MTKREREAYIMPVYSGRASDAFWKAVAATKDETLWIFACALQDIEQRVLTCINEAPKPKRRKRP